MDILVHENPYYEVTKIFYHKTTIIFDNFCINYIYILIKDIRDLLMKAGIKHHTTN